jgi:CBS-domain-containing membrane protein
MRVADIMTPRPVTIAPQNAIGTAIALMRAGGFRRLPVVENGRLVGIVTAHDLQLVSNTPAISQGRERAEKRILGRGGSPPNLPLASFSPDVDTSMTKTDTCELIPLSPLSSPKTSGRRERARGGVSTRRNFNAPKKCQHISPEN